MTLASLTAKERELVRRALVGAVHHLGWDCETRLGVTEESVHALLGKWPEVDDNDDESDACLAINNALNDLLHGLGISDEEAVAMTEADRSEMRRVYRKWAFNRGWTSTGVR